MSTLRQTTTAALLAVAQLAAFSGAIRAQGHPAATFVVIVNAANPVSSIKAAELTKLFMGKQTHWAAGGIAQPVDQVVTSATRRRFSDAVLGMDVPSIKSYWQELVFSGRGEPPPERASDDEVTAYVRANRNAIGYVSADFRLAELHDVKSLAILP